MSFVRWYQTNKVEILLFLLGFGIRFLYALAVQGMFGSHGFIAYSDSQVYMTETNNLLQRGVLSQSTAPPWLPDALRTPVYPLFLAFCTLLHLPLVLIIILQNVMAGVTCVLVYRLGEAACHSKQVGILAACLVGLEPMSIYWNNLVMSDSLFTLLFVGALLALVRHRVYFFAVLFGLATLTRPIGLYFFFFCLIFLVIQYRARYAEARVWWKGAGVVLIFFAILAPWLVRNQIIFHTPGLSSAGWLNLHEVTLRRFTWREGIDLPLPQEADSYSFANIPFFQENFRRIVSAMPFKYGVYHVKVSLLGFFDHDYDYFIQDVVGAKMPVARYWLAWVMPVGSMVWGMLYVLAIVGIWFLRRNAYAYLFIVCIFFNFFLSGILSMLSGSRFMMPLMPCIFLFVAYGWVTLYYWLRPHSVGVK